ncbi:MAG: efflux RND transporter periplasmic adaptor subunit [Nevskiaceae bacterium]|nr:efflux RND transporter periplasmic adaptor subunit [Nevskiaceae bacterium]
MRTNRRFPLLLVAVGALALALFGWVLLRDNNTAARAAPPSVTAVSVGRVEQRDVPVTINALAQAQGWQTVVVRAQVSGELLQVPVREGADVAKGDLIAQIDPAPFRAQLTQAQGALRRDQAQLDIAKLKLARYRQLSETGTIPALDVDTQAALVEQMQGTLMLDEGAVLEAQNNLNYTRIVAPISGRVGMRLLDAGNLIAANDAAGIVTINQISPISVLFTLPQGEFQRLSNASNGFRTALVTQAYGQESGELLDTGELVVVDNRVDSSTATVQLKARFANTESRLWPGQLLNVRLTLQTLRDAVALPTIAVNQGPNGPFAYVVENDTAVVRPLVIEMRQDEFTTVKSGVRPGEQVVIEGQGSLRDGARVAVRNEPTPPHS